MSIVDTYDFMIRQIWIAEPSCGSDDDTPLIEIPKARWDAINLLPRRGRNFSVRNESRFKIIQAYSPIPIIKPIIDVYKTEAWKKLRD